MNIPSSAGDGDSARGDDAEPSVLGALCDEFVRAWRRGEEPRIEDYLTATTATQRREVLLALLREEFVLRREKEGGIRVEEYLSRFGGDHETVALALSEMTRADEGDVVSRVAKPGEAHDAEARAATEREVIPPVPGHEVLGVEGRGGMGIVYRARDLHLQRDVAIKMVLQTAGEQAVSRFQAEAEAVARLRHPHIVEIFSFGKAQDRPYFIMEYVAGGSLKARLATGPLSPMHAARVVARLARALAAAHQAQVVHRDLKPSNVLMMDEEFPKIADFGLAKILDQFSQQTITGEVLGTPAYMSPEQALGDSCHVGPAADIYSLGAILYETLTGAAPFRAPTALDTLQLVISKEPVPLRDLQPDVPPDLENICLKCLNKEPTARYGSAAALAEDLERFQRSEPVEARPVGPWERAVRWSRRNPALARAISLAVLCLLLGSTASTYWGIRANRNADEARRNARQFQQAKLLSDRRLYAAQTNLVHQWIDKGQVKEARDLLISLEPDVPSSLDPRGWEWDYLVRRCNASQFELRGHHGGVARIACSDDGRWLASGGDDGRIVLWDRSTGQPIHHWTAHAAPITALDFRPQGTWLLSAGEDAQVYIWDAETAQKITTYERHGSHVQHAVFVDSQRVASTASDRFVRVWQAETGQDLQTLDTLLERRRYLQLAVSAQQRFLAGVSFEDVVLWDSAGRERRRFPGGAHVAFAPQGRQLAIVSAIDSFVASTVVLRDALGADEPIYLRGHPAEVTALSYHPDGAFLVTAGSKDHMVRVWNTSNGQLVQTMLGHEDEVRDVVFSADGSQIIAAGKDGSVRVWPFRAEGDTVNLKPHAAPPFLVDFSQDGEQILTVGDVEPRLWNARNGALVRTFGKHRIQMERPRGKHVGRIRGYDTSEGHEWPIKSAAWSPDNSLIASADSSGNLYLWNTATGKNEAKVTLGYHDHSMAWLPDGKRLFVRLGDGRCRVWNNDDRQFEDLTPIAPNDHVKFAPRPGHFDMVSATTEGDVQLWSPLTSAVTTLVSQDRKALSAIAVEPDGDRFALGQVDGTIRVGSIRRRKWQLICQGHAETIVALQFTPDGKRLISTGGSYVNRALKIWDLTSGQDVLTLLGPFGAVAVSPDGTRIAVAQSDGNSVEVFDATVKEHHLMRTPIAETAMTDGDSGLNGVTKSSDGSRIGNPLRVLAHGHANVLPKHSSEGTAEQPPIAQPDEGHAFVYAIVSVPLRALIATPDQYAIISGNKSSKAAIPREQVTVWSAPRFSFVLSDHRRIAARWQADWEFARYGDGFRRGTSTVTRTKPIPDFERCCLLLAGMIPLADLNRVRAIQLDDLPEVPLGADRFEIRQFDLEALAKDGYERAQKGQVTLAELEARLIGEAPVPNASATYNAACILTQCARATEAVAELAPEQRQSQARDYLEHALAMLRYAVELGFNDAQHMQDDDDLRSLRDNPRFQALVAEVRERKAAAARSNPQRSAEALSPQRE